MSIFKKDKPTVPATDMVDQDSKTDDRFGDDEEVVEKVTHPTTGGTAVSLTFDQLQKLMNSQAEAMATTLVREIKKPTDIEQAKLDKEREEQANRLKAMIAAAEKDEATKKAIQANCSHKKLNGASAVGGQAHSDGLVHPVCSHCRKEFTPYKATVEMLTQGVNLQGQPEGFIS